METVANWSTQQYSAVAALELERELGLSATAAAILTKRGHGDATAARTFLAAEDRHDPALMHDMADATARILEHVESGSRIVVFGDYDVDGVCSTAIALAGLRAVGAEPAWRLPSREEGYGLSADAVRELAQGGARLIVTVDCGITAVAEVELARELGVDVVVTDHHQPGDDLPACPIVHPALGDYPFDSLCGAGVALKLSAALRLAAGLDPVMADEDLELAGLATVCDMVPLVGENRRIARDGLRALARTRRPGLRALMREAALDPGDVDARAAGFRLGPRINAAGRLHRADAALELLMTPDDDRATEIARELDGLNHDRRETEQRITHEADALCAPQLAAAAIVVAAERWHPGVVGIVASRLVARHRRPCVVIALEGESGRGSGRSISAYDLHAGLGATAGELIKFGGHRMAAGLEIERGRIEPFRAALAAHAGALLAPADLTRRERVDAVVGAGALTLELAEELERLGPFGEGNPSPRLLVPGARIEHVTAMGEDGDHARFSIASGGARARGVAFRTSQRALAAAGAEPHDASVTLERNRWNGTVEARVVLGSVCPTHEGEVRRLSPEPGLPAAVAAELAAEPGGAVVPGPRRAVVDRRGQGFAGVAGALLTSGEPVLVVVADLARRRRSLERLVAGMAPDGVVASEWDALLEDPAAATDQVHVLALDPPPSEAGIAAAAAGTGRGLLHLAWGEAERAFTLAALRHRLALRPALSELWRALDDAGELTGAALAAALEGGGTHPRDVRTQARLVRVLTELDLAVWSAEPAAGGTLARGAGGRTELDASPAQRAYAARLAVAETWLSGAESAVAALAS